MIPTACGICYTRPTYFIPSAWHEHIPFLLYLFDLIRPKSFVELGVLNGTSYFAACYAVERLVINCHCYGIDTWKGDQHTGYYNNDVYKCVLSKNTRYKFSKLLRMQFDDAITQFKDNSIDILHIDGCHTYDAVKHDWSLWRPKLSSSMITLFHDTMVPHFGVGKFFTELSQQHWTFNFEHHHGLGVLSSDNRLIHIIESFGTDKTRQFFESI